MKHDDIREPRKHTKMYDEMVLRLIGGAGQLKELIGEVNALMRKYEVSPAEMQRILRFVSERHRWASYSIRQGAQGTPEKPRWHDDTAGGDEAEA